MPKEEVEQQVPIEYPPNWNLYADESLNDGSARVCLILISLGHKIHYPPWFGFKASNNKAKYNAMIIRLKLAKELKVEFMHVFSDSQLFIFQINEK